MSKSYVSMEQKQCMVCGAVYDTGSILMDTRIRNGKLMDSLNDKTVTGWGLCEGHQKLYDEDYIALVECHENHSGNIMKPEQANRTGNIAHLRRSVANEIFNTKLPDKIPMVFIEIGVLDKLKAMQEESDGN